MDDYSQEEQFMILQDILVEVINGRTADHTCPFCRKAVLVCEGDEALVHIECPGCGRTFDGTLR
jgi:hypothetical protein